MPEATMPRETFRRVIEEALRQAPLPEDDAIVLREYAETAVLVGRGGFGRDCPIAHCFGIPEAADDPRITWAYAFDDETRDLFDGPLSPQRFEVVG